MNEGGKAAGAGEISLQAPAFRYLAALAGAEAAGRPGCAGRAPEGAAEDLMRLAVRHRLAPGVLERLAAEAVFDAGPRAALMTRAAEMRRLGRLQARRTAELSAALAVEGVRHLALKGAPLSQLLYGDASARQSRDIDLLVEPASLARADAVLRRHGLRRARAGRRGPAEDPVLRRLVKDETYVADAERLIVELHWRLFHVGALAPWSFEALWAGRRTATLEGVEVPTLSPAHGLVYLACHGANHFWFRLKWLQDVARLLWTEPPEALATAAQAARGLRLEATVAAAVRLAEALLGAPAAEPLVRAADPRQVEAIARFCRRSLELPASQSTGGGAWRQLQVLRFSLRLRDSWRYRLGLLAGQLVSPLDHDQLQLPPAAAALYVPLRPALMLARRAAPAPARR